MSIFKTLKLRYIVLYNINNEDTLYCYESNSMKNKPTKIIGLKQFIFIKTNNIDTFELVHHETTNKNRVFKCDEWIGMNVLNEWIKILAPIIRESKVNHTIKRAKQDGTLDEYNNYQHKVTKQEITCPSMIKSKSDNPLKCNIYYYENGY